MAIKSSFLEYLLASNGREMAGFKRWVFQPGMLFNSRESWWGDKKPRARAHEGLDLCCFADACGQVKELAPNTRIPATFAGEVIKIERDFLGESIFLRHEILAPDGRKLYTAYGHTRPDAALAVGRRVAAGEILAALAASPSPKTKVLPHLHLTLAWMPTSIRPEQLTWQNLGQDPAITLIDPQAVL